MYRVNKSRATTAAADRTSSSFYDDDELAASASSSTPVKAVFCAPPKIPTQAGPDGIRYDFNDGCRVTLPEGNWRVRLSDAVTGNTLFETQLKAGVVASSK